MLTSHTTAEGIVLTLYTSSRIYLSTLNSFHSENKIHNTWGLGEGSAVRTTVRSSRCPGLDSHNSHGSSQLSVAPAPGDLTPSSDPLALVVDRYTCKQNNHTHKNNFFKTHNTLHSFKSLRFLKTNPCLSDTLL